MYPVTHDQNLNAWFMENHLVYDQNRFKNSITQKTDVIGIRGVRLFDEAWNGMLIDEGGIWGPGGHGTVYGNRHASRFSRYNSSLVHRTDSDVLRELYKHTPFPKFIIDYAELFVNKFLKVPFIGIHWRYNPGDFFHHSSLIPSANSSLVSIRGMGHDLSLHLKLVIQEPGYFFEQLLGYLEKQYAEIGIPVPKLVFIASPNNMAQKFERFLKQNGTASTTSPGLIYKNIEFITSRISTEFIRRNFRDHSSEHYCEIAERFYGEILPMVEMTILEKAFAFYRSRPSNWSFNIQARRFAHADVDEDGRPELLHDRCILDMFLKEEFQMSYYNMSNVNKRPQKMQDIQKKYYEILGL